ncbi:MAG TPA: PAS domain S-box protein [Deltaproteobacteria bacterium]|nr:PAS domain S-box protein [Deltaproteobacteria bacterium]HPJ92595.1 PAS domain S-box protein [Deltaproteobacteria bacterium]
MSKPTYEELEQRLARLETEFHLKEKALQETEERYRSLFERSFDAVYLHDFNGRFLDASDSALNMLGYTREDIATLNFASLISEDQIPLARQSLEELYRTGTQKIPVEFHLRCKDGSYVWVETNGSILYRNGEPCAVQGIARDITKRKETEEALRRSEARYRVLAENSSDVIWTMTLEGVFTYVSPSVQALTGFTPDEVLQISLEKYVVPESLSLILRELEMQLSMPAEKRSSSQVLELRQYTKDGSIIDIETTTTWILDDSGEPVGLQGSTRDISDRKKAEDALRQSEERFRDLAELLPETVYETDENGKLTYVNQISFKKFGYTQEDFEQGVSVFDMLIPSDHEKGMKNIERIKEGTHLGLSEYEALRSDGSTFPSLVHSTAILKDGKPSGLRGFLIDISEKKNLEQQLVRAQKMEAIGTLAGGIAHDFNNLLMGILGNVSLMQMDKTMSETQRERLKNMEQYLQRGSDLARQLLGFARGGKYEVRPTNIGAFIQNSAELFGRTKKEVHIHCKFDDDLWTVEVDQGQIEQVMLNLYVNAWQAMPGGGDLFLSAENDYLDMNCVKPHGVKPGNYVKISVTDTGVGMDAATRDRVFEPFFTTKERGRGTGLGLASAYGIIKNHGGFITVESELGVETTFTFYLPASQRPVETEPVKIEEIKQGNETVLLIDDEEMITKVGAEMLVNLGYNVLPANGGREGIEVFRKNSSRIDLVILDMIMPDMGGKETFERLKDIDPSVKVLLSSGYSLGGPAKEIMERGCAGFLQKPFTIEKLSKRVRSVLGDNEKDETSLDTVPPRTAMK